MNLSNPFAAFSNFIFEFRKKQTIRFVENAIDNYLNLVRSKTKSVGTDYICTSFTCERKNPLCYLGAMPLEDLHEIVSHKIGFNKSIGNIIRKMAFDGENYDFNKFKDFHLFASENNNGVVTAKAPFGYLSDPSAYKYNQYVRTVFVQDFLKELENCTSLKKETFLEYYDFKKFLKPEFLN